VLRWLGILSRCPGHQALIERRRAWRHRCCDARGFAGRRRNRSELESFVALSRDEAVQLQCEWRAVPPVQRSLTCSKTSI
jgi:hypothetical protein